MAFKNTKEHMFHYFVFEREYCAALWERIYQLMPLDTRDSFTNRDNGMDKQLSPCL